MRKAITSAAIWLFFALGLRARVNNVQRWLAGEKNAPRKPLPDFDTPEELERYAQRRFQYRKDSVAAKGALGLGVPLDWYTDPEVFQERLETGAVLDGDCDDYHWWFATCLERIPEVDAVMVLSSGFKGEPIPILGLPYLNGHTTCVFRRKSKWYLVDYTISLLGDEPWNAPEVVALRYSADGSDDVLFAAFERLNNDLVAVGGS